MVDQLGRTRSMRKLRRAFQDEYGVELDDEVDLFINGAPCGDDAFPVRVYDCAAPEVPWSDDTHWFYTGALACDAGDLVGGFGSTTAASVLRSRTIKFSESGTYRTHLESDADVVVQVGACFGCPWEPRFYEVGPGDVKTVDLDAGSYYVRIRGPSDVPASVQLEISPIP